MGTHNEPKVDTHSGVSTTGHEWDGITELNNPLPRWWLIVFYLTVIWAIGYWILYPSWPVGRSYLPGILHWSAREDLDKSMAQLANERKAMNDKLAATPLDQVAQDPKLAEFAIAEGAAAFAQNCSSCHGAGGQGNKGYPNLLDNDWLWGGALADIQTTIQHGIRYDKEHGVSDSDADKDTRPGAMPAFGKDGILQAEEITLVANYVRSLSGLSTEPGVDLAKGKQIFMDNCVACHGDDGKGQAALGAPNLTDKIWLYSGDTKAIIERINNGGGGVMPAWGKKLPPEIINAAAFYVHSLGGGQ